MLLRFARHCTSLHGTSTSPARHCTAEHGTSTSRHGTARHCTAPARHGTSLHVTARHLHVTARHLHVTARHLHVTARHCTAQHVTARFSVHWHSFKLHVLPYISNITLLHLQGEYFYFTISQLLSTSYFNFIGIL